MVRTSAPGKCILFGEHAVVYGQPAVAIAIEQRVYTELKLNTNPSKGWRLDGIQFQPEKHPHIDGLRKRLWSDDIGGPPLMIKISSEIPSAAGLGSSAALSVSLASAFRVARGRRVNDKGEWVEGFSSEIMNTDPYAEPQNDVDSGTFGNGNFTEIGEIAINHDEAAILGHAVEASSQGGRASPIDSSTAAHGGCILLSDKLENDCEWLYTRNLTTPEGQRKWEIHQVNLPDEKIWLVIGNSGIRSSTKKMVENVANLIESDKNHLNEIEYIGKIAKRGVKALQDADFEEVGKCMTENHIVLRGLGVSCPELEKLVIAAAPSSLGVKLTGSGGGGCMIALTRNPKQTAEAIELMGGRTIISKLGSKGVRLEDDETDLLWNKY